MFLCYSYEEAIQVVSSVRNFVMVFDAYCKSEMHMLEIIIQNVCILITHKSIK